MSPEHATLLLAKYRDNPAVNVPEIYNYLIAALETIVEMGARLKLAKARVTHGCPKCNAEGKFSQGAASCETCVALGWVAVG